MRSKISAVILFVPPCIAVAAGAATLDMPPSVPQPSARGDLVGFNLQNVSGGVLPTRTITFGQAFARGAVKPGTWLTTRDTDASRRAQLDALSLYPDGSVQFGAISTRVPQLMAGGSISGLLQLAAPGIAPPVDLGRMAPKLTVSVTFHAGGSGTQTIDLGAALQHAIANGTVDYWLHGPVATQARVDAAVSDSFHVTADITGYFDGGMVADVQFNNDLAMGAKGGPVVFDATVTFAGANASYTAINQRQYQDWHVVLSTYGSTDAVNVQHDVAALENSGAILPYDLTTGVDDSLLQGYASLANSRGFGAPLAVNGVTQYMPTTGGRPDIGYTTQYNTVWLLTQDARAAKVALAQGDAGGSAPWNLKLANGHWLTPGDYQQIWTDPRGNLPSGQQIDQNFGWTLDTAHQPDLAFVPYLMTASRWYLDRMNAQAAFDENFTYPAYRCVAASCDVMLNQQDQLRAQAWNMRGIGNAAFFGKAGSFEQQFFAGAVAHSWAWAATQYSGLQTSQGQTTGWWPGYYGNDTAEWQQDFTNGVAQLGNLRGDTGALGFLKFQRNWLIGRYNGQGFNSHDGCIYDLTVYGGNGQPFAAWSQIEAATVSAGNSDGNGWSQSNGYYCQLWRAALAGLLTIDANDSAAQSALNWLNGVGAPYVNTSSYQSDPTYNIVPLR